MEQDKMMTNEQLWKTVSNVVKRYNLLREHFQTFASEAANLAKENLTKDITIAQVAVPNCFDAALMGRTFRFRLKTTTKAGALPEGHIVMTEVDLLTKKEGAVLEDISYDGGARTLLKDPSNGDPIHITSDIGARYLVLHALYNAVA